MKTAYGCKLLGAHQALRGIMDGVVLFHSVVGCNFGSMALHAASSDMTDMRQTCTVISDNDVIFGGERSVSKALRYVKELYRPEIIFLITGCVSDMIQDDVGSVARRFEREEGIPVLCMEAAGYRGDFNRGFEEALKLLMREIELESPERKTSEVPVVNLLGFGFDDPRLEADIAAFSELLGGKAELGTVFARCSREELRTSRQADLNLVLGRGEKLAIEMERKFGIPWRRISYPYGLSGAERLWDCLYECLGLEFSAEREAFVQKTREGAKKVYSYLQALYGLPAAILASSARAEGMAEFLSEELGMEIEVLGKREQVPDLEDFYDQVRDSEAAVLFASSFEQELAEERGIPLFRFDYPVFDRVCLSRRSYIGAEGTLCLIEDLLNEAFCARSLKGALFQ